MRLRPLLVGLAVSAISLAGFWQLAGAYADSGAFAAFDAAVSAAIQSARTPPLTAIMLAVTFLGGTVAVATATVLVVVLLARAGRRWDAWYAALVVSAGGILIWALKGRLGRVRPPAQDALVSLPESFSFPSGHTMGSLCLAWVFGWVVLGSGLRPAAKAGLLVLCVLYPLAVGTSRVYLGVHWPSDVLASWLLAAALLAATTGIYAAFGPPADR